MRAAWIGVVVLAVVFSPAASLAATEVVSDFESDADLARWDPTGCIDPCNPSNPASGDPSPAVLSRVSEHATNGSYSCRMDLPLAAYTGMYFREYPQDWSSYDVLRMDIYNPNAFAVTFNLEASDSQGGYAKRHFCGKALIPGANTVEMDLHTMTRNDGTGNVDPSDIRRLTFWISGFAAPISAFVDHVRVETVQDDPAADAARGIWKFDFGTATSARWRDFYAITSDSTYPVDAATKPFGWTAGYRYSYDCGGPDDMGRDFVRGLCCPTDSPFEFRLDVPNGEYGVYLLTRAGDGHGMPTLDFAVYAEGVQKVHVPMDSSAFYTDSYYYRGQGDDYPLGQSYWDRYVEPNFPAHAFTTTVADGRLDLSFVRAYVYALIVYPTSLAGEMATRIPGWGTERETQFESTYYVNSPLSLTFAPTAEETVRGYAVWPTAVLSACRPDTLPPDPRPSLGFATEASRNEYRSVSLAIRPLGDLTDVSVEVTDLADGAGHTIAASEIECRYVRYMATPDSEFFGSGLLSWKPRLLQSDFPISVKQQVTKQLWLTVHIPDATPGGIYTGTVTVHGSSADVTAPLSVTVWPVHLDAPNEMSYGWYYMDPDERYCFSWFADKAAAGDEMLRLDFADMRKHGFNAVQFPTPGAGSIDPTTGHIGALDMGALDRFVAAMDETGFGAPGQSQVGTLSIANAILGHSAVSEFDANFDAAFKEALSGVVGWGETVGTPLVMYLVDEPRESMIQPWNRNLADTLLYCDLANQVTGVESTVTVMQDEQESVDYTPLAASMDIMQTHPWPNSAGLIAAARAESKPIWFYNTGGDLRFVYGFYNYESGNGAWEWHFDWLDGELWDPFPYSPFNNHWRYTYPSPTGPVATLNYEWASQGVWDYRYAATLDRLSRSARATGDPDAVTWADAADAVLGAVKSDAPDYPIDGNYAAVHFAGIADGPDCLGQVEEALDEYRRQIAELILAMPVTVTGNECAVLDSGMPASLEWGESGAAFATYENLTDADWTAAGGYELLSAGGMDRWGVLSVPLEVTVAPGGSCRLGLTVVAPPLTTLAYEAPVTPTTPPTDAPLAGIWSLSRAGYPLVGGCATEYVTISRFPDIQPGTAGAWARGYVEECAGRLPFIVQGFEDGTYGPTIDVTRDAMAVYIARALKLGLTEYQGLFRDVSADHWAAEEIEALVAVDVVWGFGDGTYRPNLTVTRDAMAAYVARGLMGGDSHVPEGPSRATFPDVQVGTWAYRYVECAVAHDVVKGYEDGTYRPEEPVSRDQMAVYVYRAFVQSTGSAVVLGGPGVTRVDPGEASYVGWSAAASGGADDPGYAYVLFDAVRLGTNLAWPNTPSGVWRVQFEVRPAAAPTVAAAGDYKTVVSLTADDITTANQAAVDSGDPYLRIYWDISAGLSPDDYVQVVSASDETGAMHEIALGPEFTIAP